LRRLASNTLNEAAEVAEAAEAAQSAAAGLAEPARAAQGAAAVAASRGAPAGSFARRELFPGLCPTQWVYKRASASFTAALRVCMRTSIEDSSPNAATTLGARWS
jgi:hypothetical protein